MTNFIVGALFGYFFGFATALTVVAYLVREIEK
jgi:hypothetical protein